MKASLYEITYKEGNDTPQTCTMRGFDDLHAERKFLESMDEEGGTEGVHVLSVVRIKEHPRRTFPAIA